MRKRKKEKEKNICMRKREKIWVCVKIK
jgi:hypothetical protein